MENSSTPEKRAAMYKKMGPGWKEQYRKRCHDRLKKSRDKFLDSFRHTKETDDDETLVRGLMVEEWRAMCTEHTQLPSLTSTCIRDFEFDLRSDENLDEVLYAFEEIRSELLKDEQQILRDYEAGCYYDEEAMMAAVRAEENAAPVICPLCGINSLSLVNGVLSCACGVRLDTEQDCLSLENVRSNLADAAEAHSEVCDSAPAFSVLREMELANLILICKTCDYMHIIV